ncbi:uncharacterized protein SEPMUDRAFT_75293 [Sphaerulina musiva SO2202]|uniref:Secreted protein n=1 Tax=Sphaerulina musiva (strain SO2202) TaxID=692275 RepID=N1QLZ2_SPHMS|nr:uncharacterized protein SEPMUDRAFT_75293 [Sphaerulina musiva SO2202]EMF16289.1 hypothetical protein SEPMUDRAFT_75293 [Sphaerulina musiva SO2202]
MAMFSHVLMAVPAFTTYLPTCHTTKSGHHIIAIQTSCCFFAHEDHSSVSGLSTGIPGLLMPRNALLNQAVLVPLTGRASPGPSHARLQRVHPAERLH